MWSVCGEGANLLNAFQSAILEICQLRRPQIFAPSTSSISTEFVQQTQVPDALTQHENKHQHQHQQRNQIHNHHTVTIQLYHGTQMSKYPSRLITKHINLV